MFESGTAKTKNLPSPLTKSERPKRECRTRKRPYDLEQYANKRSKYDQLDLDEQDESSCTFALTNSDSDEDNETESSDETEQLTVKRCDDNSDLEDVIVEDETANVHFGKVSSDQHHHIPVALNETILQQQQGLTRHSKRLISQFKFYYDHGLRKSIQTTDSSDLSPDAQNDEKLRGELKNTFNRLDLFKEGYCVLSSEPFPFNSLCYLCGSLGADLVYCNSCCEGYHLHCLNEYEQPRQKSSSSQFWLCPSCNVCSICGLLNSTNDFLISCFDCQKAFHFKCLKRTVDEQYFELFQSNQSVLSLSRLSNSYLINQIWFCPTCIHCDCGEKLYSNERNLLCVTKTLLSQHSQMCFDCANQLKILRVEKNDSIEKCLFCEKFIEQILSKSSKSIGSLLQCSKCQGRFHGKCDGYLSEDLFILPQVKHLISNLICSKCDREERESIRQELNNYKNQLLENIRSNLSSIFTLIFRDQNHLFDKFQIYFSNLQQFHQTSFQSLNLQIFLNDLLSLIRKLLRPSDIQHWQGVIDGSIRRQCPWFQSLVYLTNQKSLHLSQPIPSNDHTYVNQNEYLLQDLSTNSFLTYLENFSNQLTNFHQTDTRKCQLCETVSDHPSPLIGRLISFGLSQWVHAGCILAAYAKNLDQPPYILRNIRETIARCQNKYVCVLCSKLGASVHCYENECYQRFHSQCITKYYSSVSPAILQQLNIKNGFLPNLTTLCLKHNGIKTMNQTNPEGLKDEDETRNHSKTKYVNPSSTVYGDLSNNFLEFNYNQTYLCIGSLQVECLGDFDYQTNKVYENYTYNQTYPNNYRASRLFWSMKNPQKKIRYYLHIQISQSYHETACNHQIKEYPLKKEEIVVEELYESCRAYFRKYQKQIDEHLNSIEEFCQKTMVNKKGLTNQTNSRKKANTIGTGTTKRLPKATPSCVKRQTPKAALKNVSRPRNRFANEKTTTATTSVPKASNEIDNIFSKTNVSQFALALVQALRHVGQSTKIQQEPNTNFHPTNGLTTEKNTNDILLKQLLKTITVPQQNQYHSTMSTQTDTSEDLKLNGLSPHSYPSPTTDNTTNLFLKPTYIPQVDGSIDDDDDDTDSHHIIPSLLHSLIEQIASESLQTPSEHAMDFSDSIKSPSSIPPPPPSDRKQSNSSSSSPSDILIQLYQQWLKRNFFSVKFTIRNDEGYEIVGDDLEAAWFEILQFIRHTRTDMNFEHLSMANEQLNGHQIFGLTKPIVKSILNQLYSNEQSVATVSLPLSSPSPPSASTTTNVNSDESCLKKNSILSGSRANTYERRTREKQRFGWLLNQSRKIEYAVKSFEIDTALHHARRILLEEASVSLRLYHLHYFSERALLVGSSPIHGCGLFTLVDLVEGQMIIEYTGEVVRPCLTDKRERENEGKGFGCYMFTVDSTNVIDATHRGNKARFINHNCQPNCFAKTVLSGGVKHIVIYALKDVARGSELTYDYSFPEEDVKIPCHCGTTQCRVYLN